MKGILDTIAEQTSGKSFKTHKVSFDSINYPSINYDDKRDIIWKRYGETVQHHKALNLSNLANEIMKSSKPLFKFFLDGSRRTYKVDDISYGNQVFPIVAGQIGVGCCKREYRRLSKQDYYAQYVNALPRSANKDSWDSGFIIIIMW